VEDDGGIRNLVREALGEEGYRIVAASTHADALAALRAARFALVLADPVSPLDTDPDRWSSLECLRAASGDTPVVIFSAHNPDAFEGYAARGFAGLLPKPFALDDLLATVATLAPPGPPAA
jgi:CheY-like chemotaxis protein